MRPDQIQVLASYGIHVPLGAEYIEDGWKADFGLAMDAQPTLITASNAGIPAYLANTIDPEVIRVLTTPMNFAEIFGETKKGTWTDLTIQFPMVESTGEVSSYGDWNNNGSSGANINWIPRQSYHFQTISQYGERELDMYGLAKLNYKAEVDTGAALVLAKFMNSSYALGVSGLINYGALNDPGLIAAIAPTTKVAGGTTWAVATALEIYGDIIKLFGQLQSQMGGLTKTDEVMTLAMSPTLQVQLAKTNDYGIDVVDLIKKNYPNLTVKTAPEYSTGSGELMQLIIDKVDGAQTAYTAFTEKMRTHPVIQGLSNFMQKKSAGTWGWIGRRPIAIAQMIGM